MTGANGNRTHHWKSWCVSGTSMAKPRKKRPASRPRRVSTRRVGKQAAVAPITASRPFLVAAVGASAGGLEAFSSLLRGIPGDAPLALVFVQHLARDQRSILPELLANTTRFKVLVGKDEQAIEPRHVYVIPP